jgi:uncharacterized membrane protein
MRLCSLLIACLLAALPAFAQDTAVPEWQAQLEQKLRRVVTFEFVDTPLDEAVAFLRQVAGVTIVLQPAIKSPAINLKVKDCSIKDALDQIVAQSGLESAYVDEPLFIFEKGKFTKAEAPPAQPLSAEAEKTFDAALPLLRDSDFNIRENASKAIAALGRDALPKIEAAIKSKIDAEARERLARIINSFARATFDDVAPEVSKLLDRDPRKITFEFVETTLQDAVLFLGTLSKNLKVTCDAKVMNILVTLRVSDMPIGTALRWVARLSGTRIVIEGETLKLEEMPSKK